MLRLYVFIAVRQWGGATVGIVARNWQSALDFLSTRPTTIHVEAKDMRESFAVADDEPLGIRFTSEYEDRTYEG